MARERTKLGLAEAALERRPILPEVFAADVCSKARRITKRQLDSLGEGGFIEAAETKGFAVPADGGPAIFGRDRNAALAHTDRDQVGWRLWTRGKPLSPQLAPPAVELLPQANHRFVPQRTRLEWRGSRKREPRLGANLCTTSADFGGKATTGTTLDNYDVAVKGARRALSFAKGIGFQLRAVRRDAATDKPGCCNAPSANADLRPLQHLVGRRHSPSTMNSSFRWIKVGETGDVEEAGRACGSEVLDDARFTHPICDVNDHSVLGGCTELSVQRLPIVQRSSELRFVNGGAIEEYLLGRDG